MPAYLCPASACPPSHFPQASTCPLAPQACQHTSASPLLLISLIHMPAHFIFALGCQIILAPAPSCMPTHLGPSRAHLLLAPHACALQYCQAQKLHTSARPGHECHLPWAALAAARGAAARDAATAYLIEAGPARVAACWTSPAVVATKDNEDLLLLSASSRKRACNARYI